LIVANMVSAIQVPFTLSASETTSLIAQYFGCCVLSAEPGSDAAQQRSDSAEPGWDAAEQGCNLAIFGGASGSQSTGTQDQGQSAQGQFMRSARPSRP
jgi:hypothetical protein